MWTCSNATFLAFALALLLGAVYAVIRLKVDKVKLGTEIVVGLLIMFSVLLFPLLVGVAVLKIGRNLH